MDHGIEMKECESCYCQMFASSNHYSFCSGCIEQVVQNAWDMIEEIKDYEDADDMLTAKKIEDVKRCQGKIIKKEVYHGVSPFDAYNETTYSISICNNSDCEVGKMALEELEY
ncbi:4512_t:CDS:2 [Funneliformis geosporum]|nr:4512_t:CDS:2 [Funneliformis geosporum]